MKEFTSNEILFLKKILEIFKHQKFEVDTFVGEPDIRILEPHDIEYFSFVWDSSNNTKPELLKNNTIRVPMSSAPTGVYLLAQAQCIFNLIYENIRSKKSPILHKINKLIYNGFTTKTDLQYKTEEFFRRLCSCYTSVCNAWDVINGVFVCNNGLITYNRIYNSEYAYGAEELYDIIGKLQ